MARNSAFPTIRQFHQKYPNLLGEHTLRLMEKQGTLPGLRVGNRFLINERTFLEQLSHDSIERQSIERYASE